MYCKKCNAKIEEGYYCTDCTFEIILTALKKAYIEYTTFKKDSLFRDNPIALKVAIPTTFGENNG